MTAAGRPSARVETGTGWYVYGVVPADEAAPGLFDGVRGVGGGGVSLVSDGALGALTTTVPLEQFGEETLPDNLRDTEWLERNVRAHEQVLEAALGGVPVVPFRFGAIFRGEENVREMLGESDRFRAALARVRGKVELGVKGFLASEATEAADAPATGREYLEAKQRARRGAEEREGVRARLADESHARLAAAAAAAVANPLQPPELSGRDAEMFLNGAYLVAADDDESFRAALAELERDLGPSGATYELTGPWPPYNFVEDAA